MIYLQISLIKKVIFYAIALLALVSLIQIAASASESPPDLTHTQLVDRERTYNLGATGLRGWIYTRPETYLDSIQGRTTAVSRQILVTHVGAKSPSDGVLHVDDVILGVDGKLFSDDARKGIALAIQDAEKQENGGILRLTCWRSGTVKEVNIKLQVMGTYSDSAPYGCAKSKKIFDEACAVLAHEPLQENWNGAINGLALMASGNPEYLPRVRDFAHKIGPTTLNLTAREGMVIWDWGYRSLFLCEYYLLTGDNEVLPAITTYTVTLAKGQSMYGTFGHGVALPTADGKLHGSIPPYGPVNEAGLIGNLAIALGRKCGVREPEVEDAMVRASSFFGYYVDKGAIPYGEHEPWPYHENNGKGSMAAMLFSAQGRTLEAQFFAKMATAGYANREIGHTGQGFSYLWSALGANVGGPAATAAFFKEASWHFDLVRRSDGSFTYDGGEQYGPGKTDDNTYYGKSGYYGLSPTATYVLTYALPLKKIFITGKESVQSTWLSKKDVADAIASGRFDSERTKMTPQQLIAAFADWSPIVRGWAAEELARRPEAKELIPQLIAMADCKDAHLEQGACEALGLLSSVEALPVLVRNLAHKDRWVRYKAAQAIRRMDGAAKPALAEILKAIVATAEPLQPIMWADPIQLAHGQLAAALFQGQLTSDLKNIDPKLLYPAIRVVSHNADGMARATLKRFFERELSPEDMDALAPDILAAVKERAPADTMFGNEIRMGGFKALTKYKYREGIEMGVLLAMTQGGHGSEVRTGEIMKEIVAYGSAAKVAIPGLLEVIAMFNQQCARNEFPAGDLNDRRVNAIRVAIKAIQAASTQPAMKSIK